mmetsp:Transcript_23270/g.52256  ORF Transcript_23270/g.52256 Transcript_23270/m.52256 type:complete len:151 (-) Transcript_23270:49-501(-)
MADPLGVHVNDLDEDPELAAIRAKRMAQLRGKGGGPAGMGGMGGYGGYQQMDPEQQKAQQERQKAAEDQRTQILKAILSPQARERLSNIAMVKKEKARKVEDMLIMNAQRGAIGGQIDEAQLIEMLESINEQTEKETKVTFQRRRIDDDW